MWLKQFQVFQISFDFLTDLAPHLETQALVPCGPHTRTSFGWKTVDNDEFYKNIQSYSYCYFGKEERMLPASVVNASVETKIVELQNARGMPLKRHEKQQLKQDTEFSLLPKAFCVQKHLCILFDNERKRMFIQATSVQQTELILSLIVKTIPKDIEINAIAPKDDLMQTWQSWLEKPETIPHYLQLADRMQWIDEDNQQKQIRCQGYNWEEDSALDWLKKGLVPQEMSFIWRDLIQFNLNPKLNFKRVAALPSFKEQLEADEIDTQDPLSQLLMVGHTYQQLMDDLQTIL